MPIPKPSGNESEEEYVSRCMSELNTDYSDEQQRAAICYNTFREEKHERRWQDAVKKFIKSLNISR